MSVNWTRDSAAHLLRRAGFGGTPSEIDDLYGRGLEGAVSRLVDYEAIDLTAYETSLTAKNYNLANVRGLQQWFLDRMAFSPARSTIADLDQARVRELRPSSHAEFGRL